MPKFKCFTKNIFFVWKNRDHEREFSLQTTSMSQGKHECCPLYKCLVIIKSLMSDGTFKLLSVEKKQTNKQTNERKTKRRLIS